MPVLPSYRNWFRLTGNDWLVSIWGQHRHLMGLITVTSNEQDALALLPIVSRKSWIYQLFFLHCQFGALHRSRIKLLIGSFTGVPIRNSLPDWVSEIINQPDQLTNLSENSWYFPKIVALFVSEYCFFKRVETP